MSAGTGPERMEQVEEPPELPDVAAAGLENEPWPDLPPAEAPASVSGADAAEALARAGDTDAQVVEAMGRQDGLQEAVENRLSGPMPDGPGGELHLPEAASLVLPVRTGSEEELSADMALNRQRVEDAVAHAASQAEDQRAFEAARLADAEAFEVRQARERAAERHRQLEDEAALEEEQAQEEALAAEAAAAEQAARDEEEEEARRREAALRQPQRTQGTPARGQPWRPPGPGG